MSLRSKILLLSVIIPTVMVLSVVAVGVGTIDGIVYELNRSQLRSDVDHLTRALVDKWRVLQEAGVERIPRYVAAAKAEMVDHVRDEDLVSRGKLFIVTVDGQLVFHRDNGTDTTMAFPQAVFETRQGSTWFQSEEDREFCVYSSVPQVGWVLGLSVPEHMMYRERSEYLATVSIFVALLLLISVSVSYLVARKLSKRIDCALSCVQEVERGELGARIQTFKGTDELATLQRGINAMICTVEQRTQRQRRAEAALQQHRDNLENLVEARTRQIEDANAELKITNTELQAARDRAKSADDAKSDFLANMSHEIRSPMTAIMGFADNLLDGGLTEVERVDAIDTIRRNGEHLLSIINDILDLSKVESGKMTVESLSVDVCELVGEIRALMKVRTDAKGLEFGVRYESPIPRYITTDPTRLRQVLINLTGNSIKFTENGSINLAVRFQAAGSKGQLTFDVIDTGIGMSTEQAEKIFGAFNQADASTTRRFGGTGLGLTISKRFAELLGGKLEVHKTEVGVGTTFRVTVATGDVSEVEMINDPTATASIALRKPRSVRLDGLRILLAEDGPDNQRLISHVLRKAGADVVVVENGREAVDELVGPAASVYDVVLMDMQMPVMDGYEATRDLRNRDYVGLIIALTAHAMANDRAKSIDAGCDDYATKPIDRAALLTLIAGCVSDSGKPVSTP